MMIKSLTKRTTAAVLMIAIYVRSLARSLEDLFIPLKLLLVLCCICCLLLLAGASYCQLLVLEDFYRGLSELMKETFFFIFKSM